MGARALEFSRSHPVESSGYVTAPKQLEEQLARAEQLPKEQERGTAEVRAATARKRELKRSIRRSLLVHLVRVAKRAAREVPELAQKFDLPRMPIRNLAFSTVARTMLEEAQQHKELLVKHGLVVEVLRVRFSTQPDLRAAWTAASNVIGPPRAGGQADGRTGGQSQTPIKPAA